MKNEKHKPSSDELRKFAFIVGGVLVLIFGSLIPYLNRGSLNLNIIYIGSGIILTGILIPKVLYYPFQLWMFLGEILGWINTRIILSAIFFFLFTPIGLIKKLIGTDSMRRKLDPTSSTYRIQSLERPSEHMERPF